MMQATATNATVACCSPQNNFHYAGNFPVRKRNFTRK
ncbi:hypothetical protein TSACC_23344 [Terrimicrobium sacchariphilum]|uniref:Uncharacterized protein n=1 Tax=Terrimicrobium sacchariphilum TaxID=690879 RepID=A0A146GC18_TERSA|nr:hypothetical protein TSACC_23344 [Terrimicrobium sacchariphilum]